LESAKVSKISLLREQTTSGGI